MSTATAEHQEVLETRISVLSNQSQRLIQAEIREHNQRVMLENAVRDAADEGVALETISEATGLTVERISKIVASPAKEYWGDFHGADLFGVN